MYIMDSKSVTKYHGKVSIRGLMAKQKQVILRCEIPFEDTTDFVERIVHFLVILSGLYRFNGPQ